MKDLYSIGETAKLLGITVQTLQYYDKVNLVKPAFVKETTGYRYYKFIQFQLIDRIKYLQSLGLSLDEIRIGMQDGMSSSLIPVLEKKHDMLAEELKQLLSRKELLEWYIDYYKYIQKLSTCNKVHISRLSTRYALKVPHYESGISTNAEIRLAKEKNSPEYKTVKFQRQYGYILDYSYLEKDCFQATDYFIFLKEKPSISAPNIIVFPAGEYLCFSAQINDKGWNHTPYLEYFSRKNPPQLTLANEFEDNLHDFDESWYEIQMLISSIM